MSPLNRGSHTFFIFPGVRPCGASPPGYHMPPLNGASGQARWARGQRVPQNATVCKDGGPNQRAPLAILKKTSSIVLGISSIHPACPCRGFGLGLRVTGSPKRHRLQRRGPNLRAPLAILKKLRPSYSVLRQSTQLAHVGAPG